MVGLRSSFIAAVVANFYRRSANRKVGLSLRPVLQLSIEILFFCLGEVSIAT
jgi:hypothetical protein